MIKRIFRKFSSVIRERYPLAEFFQEWRAVRAGMRRHCAQGIDAARYRLRRNLHRIEKGLAMPEKKTVFAVDYIGETLDAYAKVLQEACPGHPNVDIQWAYGVLKAYFDAVGKHPAIVAFATRFKEMSAPMDVDTDAEGMRSFRDLGESPVNYVALMDALKHRKAVRWYLQKPVPPDLIDKAIAAAAQAPSACNRQAFTFVIMDDVVDIRNVTKLLIGVSGFDHQIPCLVLLIGNLQAYDHARDRHLIYVDGGLAAMNFMLAVDALGLGCCPVNWPDIPRSNKALAKLLGLRNDQRAVMVLTVGYPDPDGRIAHSERRSVDALRQYCDRKAN